MAWESVSVALVCGCAGAGSWDDTDPGDPQQCGAHGATEVKRVSRIHEARGSRNAQFGEVSNA